MGLSFASLFGNNAKGRPYFEFSAQINRNLSRTQVTKRFKEESDRAAGVLGAAFVDANLEGLFSKGLKHLQKEILGSSGPLGTFSSRIDLAYGLNWIDEETHADLHTIRKIRNEFAHSFDHELSFETQSIAARCCNLRLTNAFLEGFTECIEKNPHAHPKLFLASRDFVSRPRERYIFAIEFICINLAVLAPTSGEEYTGASVINDAYHSSADLRVTSTGPTITVVRSIKPANCSHSPRSN